MIFQLEKLDLKWKITIRNCLNFQQRVSLPLAFLSPFLLLEKKALSFHRVEAFRPRRLANSKL